jgi:hypothetical protein
MIHELERIWKETVVAKFKVPPRHFLERLRKTTTALREKAGDRVDI